jgi:hypothetical protein
MGLKSVPMRRPGLILSAMICACLLFLSAPSSSVLADGGMIPTVAEHISIDEPGQKAIIAWDGQEEILILSTDVHAEENTTALRVIPLPSEPDRIEQGDFNSFLRIRDLIYDRFGPRHTWLDCAAGQGGGGAGVDIVFHDKIGAHDIWVAKATDAAGFVNWAEDFLAQNQIQYQISSPELETLAAEYIDDGIQFFVFDLIELSPDQKSVEPIVYQFQSDALYFPLKISSIIPGYTQISLFLLTPEPLIDVSQLPESQYVSSDMMRACGIRVATSGNKLIRFKLAKGELESIDQRVADLFQEHAWQPVGSCVWLTALESYMRSPDEPVAQGRPLLVPLAWLDKDVKLTRASFGEPPGGGTPGWVWWLLGLAAVALGGLLYVRHWRKCQSRKKQRQELRERMKWAHTDKQ